MPYNLQCIQITVLLFFLSVSCVEKRQLFEKVDAETIGLPPVNATNDYYVGNRLPLEPGHLIKLPLGSVTPGGWLKECLQRQADGLMGHLGEISAWLQKEDNAWLSEDGEGSWGWEEVPYWLKGYLNTAYILGDEKMIAEAQTWIEAVLASQRPDGNFGPLMVSGEDGTLDFWPNMIMLYCLQSYYEHTNDERVLELMTEYFRYQLSLPDEELLSATHYWQRIRGGDNLHSVLWLYNRTGAPWLLELAEKIHRNTAPWGKRDNSLDEIQNYKEKREGTAWPDWYANLVDWHNVNIAQGFREPAQYYLVSHDKKDLQATYDNFNIVREHFGQVPGGMFGADEDARPGYADPRQGIETCGMVEQMNSDEHLLQITGDIFWADHAEEVAFNDFPAALMPDFKSLRYITSPNMVLNDAENHRPGIQNNGPFLMMNPFSSRCCQHNHGQGWPYFTENLWMATQDNGLAAVIYAASDVTARVGDGSVVRISLESNYPFEEDLIFEVSSPKEIEFPLYFRIPGWCSYPGLLLNDREVGPQAGAGKYIRINRTWKDGDVIVLSLPRELKVQTWEKNHNSVSVVYGPLTFSLKIGEAYVRGESDKTAVSDSKWQKDADTAQWPSYEIHPTTPWNYGLIMDTTAPAVSFAIKTRPWPGDNFPFTPENTPIVLKATGKIIPEWTIDKYGLAGELQDSPVRSQQPTDSIELIPLGAARLRISAFPVIGADGHEWVKN